MFAAAQNKEPDVVRALLDAGVDPKATNGRGDLRAIDYAQGNFRLLNTDVYWRLHDASFD